MVARADILAGRAVILVNIQDTIDVQLKSIRSKLRIFSNSFNELGSNLFRGGIVGSLGSFFPVKQFVDFQDSMLFLQSKLKDTGVDIQNLERYIRHLGATTSFSSKQVAEAAAVLAQAGLGTAVQPTLLPTLDMARAARIDIETAARILANTMSAFAVPAEQANIIASKLTTASRLGTLDIVDLGESLKESLTTFRQLGVPLDEVLGMIVQISNVSLRATKAGTSLNTAFANLASKGEQLGELGVQILPEDLQNPQVIFKKLFDALSKLSKFEQVSSLQSLFNIRGGRAMGGILIQELSGLKNVVDQIKASTDEVRQTSELMDSKLGGVIRRAVSAFEEMQLAIGSLSEGPLTTFGENLAAIFNDISRLTVKFPTLTQYLLLAGPAALVVGAGLLSITYVSGKIAQLITPLMILNSVLFQIGANIVGLHVKGLTSVGSAIRTLAYRAITTPSSKIDRIGLMGNISANQKQLLHVDDSINLLRIAKQQEFESKFAAFDNKARAERIKLAKERNAKLVEVDKKYQDKVTALQQKQLTSATNLSNKINKRDLELADKRRALLDRYAKMPNKRARLEDSIDFSRNELATKQQQARTILAEKDTKRQGLIQQAMEKIYKAQQAALDSVYKKNVRTLANLDEQYNRDNTKQLDAENAILDKRAQTETRKQAFEKAEANRRRRILSSQKKELDAAKTYYAEQRALIRAELKKPDPSGELGLNPRKGMSASEIRSSLEAKLVELNKSATKAYRDIRSKQAKEDAAFFDKRAKTRAKFEAIFADLDSKAADMVQKRTDMEARHNKMRLEASNKYAAARAKVEERITRETDQFNNRVEASNQKMARRMAALQQQQIRELDSFQSRILAARNRFDARTLRLQRQIIQADKRLNDFRIRAADTQAKLADRQQRQTAKLDREIQRRGPAVTMEQGNKARQELAARQARERAALRASSTAEMAALEKQVDKEKATLTKAIERDRDKLSKDKTSFWKKDRGPGLFVGLMDAGKDMFTGIRKGFNLSGAWKNFDFVSSATKAVYGLGRAFRGVFTVLNGIRRFVFSFSGILTIFEVLFLFGDRIPGIKDVIASAGVAISTLFSNLGQTFKSLIPSFGQLWEGIKLIFSGNSEAGAMKLVEELGIMKNLISAGLTTAWAQFTNQIRPAIDLVHNLYIGLMGVFEAIVAILGSNLATIFKTGSIVLESDGSLMETIKAAFSPENLSVFFSGIVAAIGEVGKFVNQIIGTVAEVLNLIKQGFVGILQMMTLLKGTGAAATAQSALDSADTNAPIRKALQDKLIGIKNNAELDIARLNDKYSATERSISGGEYQKEVSGIRAKMFADLKATQDQIDSLGPAFGTIAYAVEEGNKSISDAINRIIDSFKNMGNSLPNPNGDPNNPNATRDNLDAAKEFGMSMGDAFIESFPINTGDIPAPALPQVAEIVAAATEVAKAVVGSSDQVQSQKLQAIDSLQKKWQGDVVDRLDEVADNTANLKNIDEMVFV